MKRACFVVALLLLAIPAKAQEAGQSGLAVGIPGSIGVIWHLSDSVAIRPDFSFTHTHSESESVSGTKSDSSGYGFGVSALFYTGKIRDNVRTYVSPRFGYTRTTSKSETPSVVVLSGTNPLTGTPLTSATLTSTGHQDNYTYGGAFGVQYTPTRRFSVYGEAGVQYSDIDATYRSSGGYYTNAEGKSSNSQFSTRGGVGVVFYFK